MRFMFLNKASGKKFIFCYRMRRITQIKENPPGEQSHKIGLN